MAKYIERDAFIAWLKKIPMVDLSDGRGLCRVIFEDDFKRAIKNMPENIIHGSEVFVRCENCRKRHTWECAMHYESVDGEEQYGWENDNDFCSWGERKDGDGNG